MDQPDVFCAEQWYSYHVFLRMRYLVDPNGRYGDIGGKILVTLRLNGKGKALSVSDFIKQNGWEDTLVTRHRVRQALAGFLKNGKVFRPVRGRYAYFVKQEEAVYE